MRYVCDAPGGKTWFRIETEAEAVAESDVMRHAVEKFFRKEKDKAAQNYQPPSKTFFEQDIGLKAHLQREMPRVEGSVHLAVKLTPQCNLVSWCNGKRRRA